LKYDTKQIIYLILSLITIIAGYFYLRYAYKITDTLPFTQEIVLIILGTITTIFITALLLNKQTAVEVEKEQNIKFLELKSKIYEELLKILETMSIEENFKKEDLVRLQFITHKLAIVASNDVLNEYQNFLNIISELTKDNSFKGDTTKLFDAISSLTIQIRQDLIGESNKIEYSKKQIIEIIKNNSKKSLFQRKNDKRE
jgi:hypothetical protein